MLLHNVVISIQLLCLFHVTFDVEKDIYFYFEHKTHSIGNVYELKDIKNHNYVLLKYVVVDYSSNHSVGVRLININIYIVL